MLAKQRVVLKGSTRHVMPGSRAVGAVNPEELADLTLLVRASNDPRVELATLLKQPAAQRKFLTHDELEQKFRADPADLDRVESFAHEHGLSVAGRDAAKRTIVVRGSLRQLSAAFGVTFELRQARARTYRARTGPILIPTDLDGIVTGVFGLDTRPVARVRRMQIRAATSVGETGASLAKRYRFPSSSGGTMINGSGQCVALIELGGGYHPDEIRNYVQSLQLGSGPKMVAISVDGGHNTPSNPNGADGEVALDLEVVAAAAPGASIAVYFAPNTNRGFVDAVAAAVHDKTNKPSTISISWGMPETAWPEQYRKAMDDVFHQAALLGITVCAASGDHGTNDLEAGEAPGAINVDYPAASDVVLGCGGTMIVGKEEVAWNDGDDDWSTGGGISTLYPVPDWQTSANKVIGLASGVRGRGVPDVAGCATNYHIVVDGFSTTSGGTSAVAPLWASLVARINQALGRRVGFINPALYAHPEAFTDIVAGADNAAHGATGYGATAGWDACTGLGVPVGDKLIEIL